MNKEKLMINYCINTAIDGFEDEDDEVSGEKWLANVCIGILKSKVSIDEVGAILNVIVENSKYVFNENFFNGVLLMYLDIKEQIKKMQSKNFETEFDYEIRCGVFSDM